MTQLPGLDFQLGEDIEVTLTEIAQQEERCKRLLNGADSRRKDKTS